MIHVSPFLHLEETLAASGATYLISLASPGQEPKRPERITEDRWLPLCMNDIAEEREGLIAPQRHHVEAALNFARWWNRDGPLVVSCYAGISRSTAISYIIAAMVQPGKDEAELASSLRSRSPSATPNPLIVALGDEIIERGGRMVEAIRSIGRGRDAFSGTPFHLDIERR